MWLPERSFMTDDQDTPRALVLGGSCRLSLNLTPRLLAAGIRPLLAYRSNTGKERIRTELGSLASEVDLIQLDFADPATLSRLAAFPDQRLDYLVDFAQGDYEVLIAAAKDEAVRDYFSANLSFRAAVLTRAARAMLTRRRGRMVFISSTAAARPNPGQGFYAAAKLAAEAIYRNLGLEMASKGITTAILRPGYIDAGRGRRYLENRKEMTGKLNKTKQVVSVDDLTDALMFLLLASGAGINGTVLTVDGGLTAGK